LPAAVRTWRGAFGVESLPGLSIALSGSHLLPSVRGELLGRLGRDDEARAELGRAVALCGNERERTVLRRKITDLANQA
jgi:predicted RNA polymerase sigma factor